MKKVVLLVVLAMFVAVPAFALTSIGSGMIIPQATTLAGFASIGQSSTVSASGPMSLIPLGGSTVTGGGNTVVTNPTSQLEVNNVASIVQLSGIAGIQAIPATATAGVGLMAQSPTVSQTATAGAIGGGTATVSGTMMSYSVAGMNIGGLGNYPIASGFSF